MMNEETAGQERPEEVPEEVRQASVRPEGAAGGHGAAKPRGRWVAPLAAVVALAVGFAGGWFARQPKVADLAAQTDATQKTLDAAQDDLQQKTSENQQLTQENAELTQQLQQFTKDTNSDADALEIVDIRDLGETLAPGYRDLEFTVKNNYAAVLSIAFVNFSMQDANGNSVCTGQATTNSVQLQPGKTAVMTSTVKTDDSNGTTVVPAQWSATDINGHDDSGTYTQAVKTLQLP